LFRWLARRDVSYMRKQFPDVFSLSKLNILCSFDDALQLGFQIADTLIPFNFCQVFTFQMRQVAQDNFVFVSLFGALVAPNGERNRKASGNLEKLAAENDEAGFVFEITTGRILVAEYQLVVDSVLWNLRG
jgi:hypothetical protein